MTSEADKKKYLVTNFASIFPILFLSELTGLDPIVSATGKKLINQRPSDRRRERAEDNLYLDQSQEGRDKESKIYLERGCTASPANRSS